MARTYEIAVNGTVAASTTLPFLTLMGASTVRGKICDFEISSDATPADAAAKYAWQRCTSAGTPGTSPVAVPIDAADPAAICTVGLLTFTGGPTLTANTFLKQIAVNQRNSFRWVPAPGKELVIPATTANGLALMTPVVNGTAFNAVLSVTFEE